MRVIIGLLLGVMVCGSAARAEAASIKEKDDGPICVGGPSWRPTFEESRGIEAEPVPASYRRMFESTEPCVKWAMGIDGLIAWHLRFGTAASVSAALAYIERDNRRSVPAPEGYLPLLRAAFRAAEPDLNRSAALKQPPDLSYSVRYKFMQQSKPIARLNALLRAREDYVFFAKHYLRAAEEFADPALFAKAEAYVSTVTAAASFLEPIENKPPVNGQLHFNLQRFETDDLLARAALLRVRMIGDEADLEQADTILKTLERPTDRALAGLAYSGGDDFCDITDGVSESKAIGAACRAEDDIHQRLSNLVIDRAQYDAIAAGLKGRELDTAWSSWTSLAERLLGLEALPDHGRCCGRTPDEDRLRLLVTRAYYGARVATETSGPAATWEEKNRRYRAWYEALGLLQQAERLAPPYASPARFTRVAGQWLTIWEAGPALLADRGEHVDPMQDAEKRRFAAYLAASLNGLKGAAASR